MTDRRASACFIKISIQHLILLLTSVSSTAGACLPSASSNSALEDIVKQIRLLAQLPALPHRPWQSKVMVGIVMVGIGR
jgi:hypothetical protein